MKPLNRKNYGSIPHLSNSKLGEGDYYINPGQERILTLKKRDKHDNILVFEKYDGSNVGVAKKEGKIYAITRAGYEAKTSPFKQHHLFHEWVLEREEIFHKLLAENERLAGEWLVQAHGLIYHLRQEPIVFFDFFDANNQRKPFQVLQQTGLTLPRLLHMGDAVPVETLIPLLNKKSHTIWTEEVPEGMVYRVERKDKVDFLAKWVRLDFQPGKYAIGVDDNKAVWNIFKE